VGTQLAEFLGISNASRVAAVESLKGGTLRTRTMIEGGYRVLETALPALITVAREINTPRFTSLLGVMEAEMKPLVIWSSADLGIRPEEVGFSGSPTQTGDVFMPEIKRKAEVLRGEPEEIVKEILRRIRQALGE
jgi:electron transfer flavoprotein beta subunit